MKDGMHKLNVGVVQPVDFSCCSNIPTEETADKFLEMIKRAAENCGITVVKTGWSLRHPFVPNGLTLVLILAESDITFHTWPEDEYGGVTATLDICGKGVDLEKLIESLAGILGAEIVEVHKKEPRDLWVKNKETI